MNRFFMLLGLIFSVVVVSTTSAEMQQSLQLQDHHLLHTLIANGDTCILSSTGDKIYLNRDSIVTKNREFFLQIVEMELVPLPVLRSDYLGFYLEANFQKNMERRPSSMGPCPACGHPTSSSGRCVNESCSFYRFIVLTEDDVK